MPKIDKKYYWDSNCMIAWLNGGQGHPPDVLAGLEEIANEVTANRAVLFTSIVIDGEVLQARLTPEQFTKFSNLFKRRNVNKVAIDGRVSTKGVEIRNYYAQRGINISLTDAYHLATAIIYGADEFDTLDGSGKKKRRNDLLNLGGDVAGHPLHIRVPKPKQPGLFDTVPTPSTGDKNAQNKAVEPAPAPVQGSSVSTPASAAPKIQEEIKEAENPEEKVKGPPSL